MQRTNTLNYVLVLFSILKSYDFESACLPGVWLEPVVSPSYYSPGRQHVAKSIQLYKTIKKRPPRIIKLL